MRGRVSRIALVGALTVGLLGVCLAQARTPYYLSFHPPTAPPKKGVVMTIHGGGWDGNYGAEADTIMSFFLRDFESWGYRTFNLAFREGRPLEDTYAAVEHLAKRYPKRPLCVMGGSSGGHLALMAAIERPDLVDCVIDIGGPIDFLRPEPGRPSWYSIRNRAAEVFGEARLRKVSPIYRTKRIEAAVLIISAECDIYTSIDRQRELTNKVRRGLTIPLEYDALGTNLGGHCPVSNAAIQRMRQAERGWLDRFAD